MAGTFIAVVGASGVGKDAVMSAARSRLEPGGGYCFPARFITRPSDAGGEDHSSLTEPEFLQAAEDERFSLWWKAHGLHYGLPDSVSDKLKLGTHVIANISRSSIDQAIVMFGNPKIIEITARPDTVSKRLLMRGRETGEEIAARQSREVSADWNCGLPVSTISNDGSLEEAVDMFIAAVLRLSGQSAQQVQTA